MITLTHYRFNYICCIAFSILALVTQAQDGLIRAASPQARSIHRFSSPAPHNTDTFFVNLQGLGFRSMRQPGLDHTEYPSRAPMSGIHTRSVLLGNLTMNITFAGTTCGASNGNVSVVASGGLPPYQYAINTYPYQNNGAFAGLAAGTYTMHVMDANGEMQSAPVTLTNTFDMPSLHITTYSSVTGCTAFDGSVTLSASGGISPYTFSDDEVYFQSSNIFSGLAAGNYSFFVKDANGCQAPYNFDLDPNCPGGFGFSDIASVYSCVNNGVVNILKVFYGTAPYSFSLDGINFQSSGEFDGLSPGHNHIYIRDATGKTMVYTFTMYPFCPILLTATATDAACNAHDGSISISPSNGTAPFLYSTDGVNYQNDPLFSGLASGTYHVWVRDANGLYGSLDGVKVESLCPVVTAVSTAADCGQSDGSITVTGSKGTPPYEFSIDGTNFQSGNIFTGLPSGKYGVTIRDAGGLSSTSPATVSNACITVKGSTANARCGNNNGSILVGASDGTAPYLYSLDGINFQSNNSFENLGAGNYQVWAKDATGLKNYIGLTITNSLPPDISARVNNPGCDNNDGFVIVSGSGGTGALEYALTGFPYQSANEFSGLATGDYVASVADNLGCTSILPVRLSLNNTLTADAGSDITVCEGSPFRLKGTTNASTYSWTPATGLDDSNRLNAGGNAGADISYQLNVREGICTASDFVQVMVSPAPHPDAGSDVFLCTGKSTRLNGSGGIAYRWHPIDYLSDPSIPDPEVEQPAQTTTYFLSVKDARGCNSLNDDEIIVHVIPSAELFAGHDTVIARNEPLQLNAFDVNNSGFIQYQWSPVAGLSNTTIPNPVAVIDNDITYQVKAIAPGGCTGEAQIKIKVYAGPEIYVPNAFTPNGNGHNDILKAFPVGISRFRYFAVFNRWGQRVFYTEDAGKGWDGNWEGLPQSAGGFVWMSAGLDYQGNPVIRKGTVLLIR